MSHNQNLFSAQFPDLVCQFDYPLADKTYFKIGGPAEIYCETADLDLVKALLSFCDENSIPWTILGGASNVLIADKGIPGLVLRISAKSESILIDTESELLFEIEAGAKTNALVMATAKLGASGLEGFIGVPGTVAGAIFNNAHYLDFLIGDYVESITAFHVKENKEYKFSQEQCQFAYEQSLFQTDDQLVILKACFRLKKAEPSQIMARIKDAQQRRQDTQPLSYPSSGCVFQNPPNNPTLKQLFPQFASQSFIPAGFLIDQAGLKGQQIGQIAVSEKHAAFLINLAKADEGQLASAKDVLALIDLVKNAVKDKFNISLEEEIFYLPKRK